jgi:hypothetical protein
MKASARTSIAGNLKSGVWKSHQLSPIAEKKLATGVDPIVGGQRALGLFGFVEGHD